MIDFLRLIIRRLVKFLNLQICWCCRLLTIASMMYWIVNAVATFWKWKYWTKYANIVIPILSNILMKFFFCIKSKSWFQYLNKNIQFWFSNLLFYYTTLIIKLFLAIVMYSIAPIETFRMFYYVNKNIQFWILQSFVLLGLFFITWD